MTKPLFGGGKPASAKPAMVLDAQPVVQTPLTNSIVAATLAPTLVKPSQVALRPVTDQEIDAIGHSNGMKAASTSRAILDAVKASDTEQFGQQLNALVATTKGLDPSKMGNKGLIGKITGMFGNAKEQVLGQVQTVEKRMDTLVGEMEKSVVLYTKRIGDIEKMFEENFQTHEALGREIVNAEELLLILNAQLANEQAATDAFSAQRLADQEDRIQRVEKKIDDLKRGQHLCKLAAPELRRMQSNSRALAETFQNIKAVTIPAYMGVFSRYVLNLEAKKGAELATSVADATDAAFRMQADSLRENTQTIAKAKQRAVVSIETIEHMQTQLLASYDDAKKIADEGRKARQEAAPKLQAMEQELVSRFVPQQITS